MADRSSAYILGRVFEMIADELRGAARDRVAADFWHLSREYDFTESQMHADEALILLGYARKGIDPEYPEDGEGIIYGRVDQTGSKAP